MKTIVSTLVVLSVVVGLVDPVGRSVNPSAATLASILFDVAERYDP
jgi:hypothetical protein